MNYIATRDGVELLNEDADSIYMRYIATRPRAEKHGEHGLFGAEDAVDLKKATQELLGATWIYASPSSGSMASAQVLWYS